jgi:hypothetical protein
VSPDPCARRAARLLRWYPWSWRARYGEEFAELLAADLAERPHSWRRTADVIGNGLLARCTLAGLTSHELPPAEQIPAGLGTLGCALAAFLMFGVSMLAQLATGWQWSSAGAGPPAAGTVVMAIAAGCLALLAVAAVLPLGVRAAGAVWRRDGRVARPAALATVSAVALAAGAHHFANAWPGTGGSGAHQGLVPAGAAAFGWASTLSVSSYWAHPALLGRFPGPELAWMALSPVAAFGLVGGLTMTVRRIVLPTGLLRYLARLAAVAIVAAVALLAGAASWVLGRGPAQAGLFRPGLVGGAGLSIMALALIVALRAAAAIRHSARSLPRPG